MSATSAFALLVLLSSFFVGIVIAWDVFSGAEFGFRDCLACSILLVCIAVLIIH